MPNQITATLTPIPTSAPTDGWKIQYRKKGTTDPWYPATALVFTTYPTGGFVFSDTHYPDGTLYEVAVTADCGAIESTPVTAITQCACPATYTATLSDDCQLITTASATVLDSTSCLASTGNNIYSSNGTKIYKIGFNADTLYVANDANIEYKMITKLSGTGVDPYQWINIVSGNASPSTTGPLNRVAVGVDTNCDRIPDVFGGGLYTAGLFQESQGSSYGNGNYPNVPLTLLGPSTGKGGATADVIISGQKVVSFNINNPGYGYVVTDRFQVPPLPLSGGSGVGATYQVTDVLPSDVTVGGTYNNTSGAAKTIYVGIGGSQDWTLKLNGNKVVSTKDKTGGSSGRTEQYSYWHIVPVVTRPGMNYFSVITTFNAATINGIGVVAYDNTSAQIAAATNDSQLSIIFTTKNLRGVQYGIVQPCPDNATLYVHPVGAPLVSSPTLQYDCVTMTIVPCNGSATTPPPTQIVLTWEYANNAGTGGKFNISVNNQSLVNNITATAIGSLNVNVGDIVVVTVTSPTGGNSEINVTGNNSYNGDTTVPTTNTKTFTIASGDDVDVEGYSNAPVVAPASIVFDNYVCNNGTAQFDVIGLVPPLTYTITVKMAISAAWSWGSMPIGGICNVSVRLTGPTNYVNYGGADIQQQIARTDLGQSFGSANITGTVTVDIVLPRVGGECIQHMVVVTNCSLGGGSAGGSFIITAVNGTPYSDSQGTCGSNG